MSYKMTHPASDQTIEVNADQVPMYESQGWESPTAKPPTEDGEKKKS